MSTAAHKQSILEAPIVTALSKFAFGVRSLQSWSKVVGTFFCNYLLTDISSRKQQKREIS